MKTKNKAKRFPALLISLLLLLPILSFCPNGQAVERPIDNGWSYYLRNKNSGMCMDLVQSGTTNTTQLQQYAFGYPSELFHFTCNSDGYYIIETTLIGATQRMVLDGRSNCVEGAQVIIYEYDASCTEQQWQVKVNSNGTFCLSPRRNPSLNLAVEGGSTASNARLKLVKANASAASQQWYIDRPSDANSIRNLSVYNIRNKKSGKYLDLQGNGYTDGTHFQQYTYGASYTAEKFYLHESDDGYYHVWSAMKEDIASYMAMDGRANCVAGAQVILYRYDYKYPEQRWHIRRNADGSVFISPKKNVYLNLAVEGGSTANNAKVKLAARNENDDAQKWIIEPVNASLNGYNFRYMLQTRPNFNYIYSGYKRSDRTNHYALDICGDGVSVYGQPVCAPVNGRVVYTEPNKGESGYYLVLETDCFWTGSGKRIRLTFAHMNSAPLFEEGDLVRKGDVLGYVGSTGNSSAPHLHFAAYRVTSEGDHWEREHNSLNPEYFYPPYWFVGKSSSVRP
ncbi:MAG: peptidoglycan DD-metalloendopeptidase family protein [Clostridiales bacterium]|nr:peptidoglycan DD-metalloendopeptidase family protein [Clostridiales bacterium]